MFTCSVHLLQSFISDFPHFANVTTFSPYSLTLSMVRDVFQPLQHVQITILSCKPAYILIPITWWILSTSPFEHIQMANLSCIRLRCIRANTHIPSTWWILSTSPLQHIRMTVTSCKPAYTRIPIKLGSRARTPLIIPLKRFTFTGTVMSCMLEALKVKNQIEQPSLLTLVAVIKRERFTNQIPKSHSKKQGTDRPGRTVGRYIRSVSHPRTHFPRKPQNPTVSSDIYLPP